jgi:hypothetical protein
LQLPADLGEVHVVTGRGRGIFRREIPVGGIPGATEEPDDLDQRRGRHHFETLDEGGFRRVGCRDHDPVEPRARGGHRDREHPRRGDERPTQRQLAHERVPRQPIVRHLRRSGEDAHRDREIQPGAVLAQVAGREVHDDPAQRPLEARAFHGGADPFACVLNGGAGQTRQRERREPATDVRLDGERTPANPDDGDTDDLPVHDRATLASATDTS